MPEGEIFTSEEYREVYPIGIEHHFWNIARNDLVHRWLSPHLRDGDLVMDVGCGTGIVVNELKSRGVTICGVELGAAPVMPGLEDDVQTETDLFDLDDTLKARISIVLLLDVIEHIQDRQQFLQRIFRELPNCRLLLLTVPARMEIWSDYDRHWGHYLRYDRRGLEKELLQSGFTPQKTAYFFHWVYLASIAMGLLGLAKSTDFQAMESHGIKAFCHRLLGLFTRLESRLVPGFVAGSSIACSASRCEIAEPPPPQP